MRRNTGRGRVSQSGESMVVDVAKVELRVKITVKRDEAGEKRPMQIIKVLSSLQKRSDFIL